MNDNNRLIAHTTWGDAYVVPKNSGTNQKCHILQNALNSNLSILAIFRNLQADFITITVPHWRTINSL